MKCLKRHLCERFSKIFISNEKMFASICNSSKNCFCLNVVFENDHKLFEKKNEKTPEFEKVKKCSFFILATFFVLVLKELTFKHIILRALNTA